MARQYFGTDGVRGVVGESLTVELVERLGRAAALWCGRGRVFVGRDTRASGVELEEAFARGVASAGGTAVLAGVLPTPETFGFVILNTPGSETTVRGEVVLKHAAPDTTYPVVFVQQVEGSSCVVANTVSNAFTTNERGNANLHFKVPRDPTATKFWVGIGLEPGTFGSPAVELD